MLTQIADMNSKKAARENCRQHINQCNETSGNTGSKIKHIAQGPVTHQNKTDSATQGRHILYITGPCR